MGGRRGATFRYMRDAAGLVPPERELVERLLAAYPLAVHYGECCHLSTGEWASGS